VYAYVVGNSLCSSLRALGAADKPTILLNREGLRDEATRYMTMS
jgi:hypothetical protein